MRTDGEHLNVRHDQARRKTRPPLRTAGISRVGVCMQCVWYEYVFVRCRVFGWYNKERLRMAGWGLALGVN
eukprot:6544038-Prymnesium_polylepis.1